MSELTAALIPEYLLRREQARRGERLVQLLASLAALVCILAAGWLLPGINAQRQKLNLVFDPTTIKGLPPDIVLLRQTGTLRGFLVGWLWYSSTQLKEKGQVYESAQLASWICRLLPNFPSVWAFHAWDQAYNISVQRYTAEERWKWVHNGIKLFRDEAIVYNPKSVKLYKELGWIFYHKIGDTMDDYHLAYKRELAVMMQRVLGPPPPADTIEAGLAAFRPIALAPREPADLVRADAEVRDLCGKLAELGLKPDEDLLEFVARNLQVSGLLKEMPENAAAELRRKRLALLTDPQRIPARDRLLACLRGKVLREKFKLDPPMMLKMMEEFGPMDWRSPFTIGLYWCWLGDIVTRGYINTQNEASDSMNTVRNIFFCLQQTVTQGKLILDPNWDQPNASTLHTLADVRFIDRLHRAYLEYGKIQFGDDPEFVEGTSGPNYKHGHYNFLSLGIQGLYLTGEPANLAKAEEYYAYLRKFNRAPDGSVQERYLVPLKEFVEKDLREAIETSKGARQALSALVWQGLYEMSQDKLTLSRAALALARRLWDMYMEDKRTDRQERRKLEDLQFMWADGAAAFMQSALPVIYKSNLWRNLDLPTQDIILDQQAPTAQLIYDEIHEYLAALCAQHDPPLDLDKAFPAPPGMDEYRKHPITRPKPEENVSEGSRDFSQ